MDSTSAVDEQGAAVDIYTDGSCLGNPGPGGWGALLRFRAPNSELAERSISGGEPSTTNNRMELTAAIRGLEALTGPATVHLHTDSKYVRDGITAWIENWRRNGWRTAKRKPVKNVDLWRELDAAVGRHDVTWHWVKAHAGHAENERADALAAAAAQAAQLTNS